MSTYEIILRGVKFTLEEENIRFDSPNYFTSYFFGEFEEGVQGKRELALNRHPDIFKLIFEYLCGYEIFPLADAVVPQMSNLALLQNLRRDALFYGLDGLTVIIGEQLEMIKPKAHLGYEYTIFIQSLGRAFGPGVARYRIPEEHVSLYLEQFKKGELGSQSRDWLPLGETDEVIAVWSNTATITTLYAIVRRPKSTSVKVVR